MEKKNRILIDWLTFTTRKRSLDQVFELLGIDRDNFIDLHHGFNGYKSSEYFDGISVCYDGSKWVDDKGVVHDMGIMVNISGKGCRAFEDNSSRTLSYLLLNLVEDLDDINITRMDLAFDDFEGVLDINFLADDFLKKNYVTRFHKCKLEYSIDSDIEGKTLYFGSEKSDLMYRIYDKKAEQKIIDDSMHWVRFEMQCRNKHAETLAELICQDFNFSEVFFNTLNNQLRFVTPSETDSNKRRWSITSYWERFLEYRGSMSLYKKVGEEYDDDNVVSYLNTYSGALYTLCSLYGIEFLLNFLIERSSYKFNPKYELFLKSKGISLSDLPSEIELYLKDLKEFE